MLQPLLLMAVRKVTLHQNQKEVVYKSKVAIKLRTNLKYLKKQIILPLAQRWDPEDLLNIQQTKASFLEMENRQMDFSRVFHKMGLQIHKMKLLNQIKIL